MFVCVRILISRRNGKTQMENVLRQNAAVNGIFESREIAAGGRRKLHSDA
jgi:hypothetical protein